MKIKYIIIILLTSAFSFSIFAQDSLNIEPKKTEINDLKFIKFSPLTIIELEPSFQLGFEYPWKKVRLQHEIGYVGLFNPTYQLFNWNMDYETLTSKGFKLRTTIKFPLKSPEYAKYKSKYFGIDFMYKYLSYTQNDIAVYRMNAYFEYFDFTTTKQVFAVHFTFGINKYISEMNNIITDSYFGIGLRTKSFSTNLPSDITQSIDLPWYDEISNGMILSIMGGFKFGFGI